MNHAGRPLILIPYTWATPLWRPRLATEPTYLCRYSVGARPRRTPTRLSGGRAAAPQRLAGGRDGARVAVGEGPGGPVGVHPVPLFRLRPGVVPQARPSLVPQPGERLAPGVPPADEHERERRRPGGRVGRRGRDVEPFQHLVAQVDGLADGLEADRLLAQAGDRQGPRDATGGGDDVVGLDLARRPDDRLDGRDPPGVVDPDDPA